MTMPPALPFTRRLLAVGLVVGSVVGLAGASAAQEADAPPPIPEPPRFAGGTSTTFEDVAADLFYWGQSATLTGELLDNAFLGGAVVGLDAGATVGGDLFVFASSTTIDGEVRGDVYAFTSSIRVSDSGVIHGNLMVMSGNLQVDGAVRGHLLGGGGGSRITGEVGAVDIEAGSLVVTETARVHGDLQYQSNEEAEIADGAEIGGQVLRNEDGPEAGAREHEHVEGFGLWSALWTIWRYLSALLVGVVVLLVGGRIVRRPERRLAEGPAAGLGYGFVVAVVFPVACLLAVLLIVSLPLGVLGLILFGVSLFLAYLVTAQYVGTWILERATGRVRPSEYVSLALGLAVLLVVSWIPYLGFLIRLTAVVLGLGGIFLALRTARLAPPTTSTRAVPPAAPSES